MAFDFDDEIEDDTTDLEETLWEDSEDEPLEDIYNKLHVATREIDELAVDEEADTFRGTPLHALIKSVSELRRMNGPSDPTINDLCEELESSLTLFVQEVKLDPFAVILSIANTSSVEELKHARQLIDNLIQQRGGE